MKDQHTMISGYRDLSGEEIGMMNHIKEMERQANRLVKTLEDGVSHPTIGERPYDARWVAIGKTDMQKAFMALIRAVAQPEELL